MMRNADDGLMMKCQPNSASPFSFGFVFIANTRALPVESVLTFQHAPEHVRKLCKK
jgi:hypothetical protein